MQAPNDHTLQYLARQLGIDWYILKKEFISDTQYALYENFVLLYVHRPPLSNIMVQWNFIVLIPDVLHEYYLPGKLLYGWQPGAGEWYCSYDELVKRSLVILGAKHIWAFLRDTRPLLPSLFGLSFQDHLDLRRYPRDRWSRTVSMIQYFQPSLKHNQVLEEYYRTR